MAEVYRPIFSFRRSHRRATPGEQQGKFFSRPPGGRDLRGANYSLPPDPAPSVDPGGQARSAARPSVGRPDAVPLVQSGRGDCHRGNPGVSVSDEIVRVRVPALDGERVPLSRLDDVGQADQRDLLDILRAGVALEYGP
jgi:hypothetical protein